MSDSRRLLPALGFVALGLAGCVTSGGAPQVQDLSVSRNSEPPSTYTVKAGDTLYGIAWQNNLDFRDLAHLNGITPPYRIQPGQTLRLEPKGDARAAGVQQDASISDGAVAKPLGHDQAISQNDDWLLPDAPSTAQAEAGVVSPVPASEVVTPGPVQDAADSDATPRNEEGNTSEDEAVEAQPASADQASEDAGATASADVASRGSDSSSADGDAGTQVAGESDTPRDAAQGEYHPVDDVAWQWPAAGKVIGKFGDDSSITAGIDIAGEKGQPVKAAGPGIVVYAGSGVRGYGNLIILKHNDHFLSAYAHNDTLRVEENDVVEGGDVIATMGDTDAERVKLHFEVRQDGQPQDPLEYLPAR